MKYLSLALGLAASTWACSGNPTAPSAPSVPTRPISTLSGLVFAATPAGLAPVEGARVRLEIGSFRADATSDQNGLYTLSGLYEGTSTVSTTRDGYDTDTRRVAISGECALTSEWSDASRTFWYTKRRRWGGHLWKASTSTVMDAVQSTVTPGCPPTGMGSIASPGRITVSILS